MLRSGDFCVHDNDDDDNGDRTNHFTPCTCTQGKKWVLMPQIKGLVAKVKDTVADG